MYVTIMIRCRISADIKDLNKLHETHRWIPNESMIRPNEKTLEIKQQFNTIIAT